jgi:16S rRNA (cytosine1402-N4)-methyltransferase
MHKPVLLDEVIELLHIRGSGRYVDGTLGLGGHAEAILNRLDASGQLLGVDVDPQNLKVAENRLQPFEKRAITRQSNFRGLPGILRELKWEDIDGLLLDLGVSSVQLENPKRGFSFKEDGPLDMRLDPTGPQTALSLLAQMDEPRLTKLLIEYGEGRFARKLSRYILADVRAGKIKRTTDLARICERVCGWSRNSHPATRVFLALRALVNDEWGGLKEVLEWFPGFISVGGRVAIITFHSGEDRLVKQRFQELEKDGGNTGIFRRVSKKPVVPTLEETRENPRSRSAKLRVLERIQ